MDGSEFFQPSEGGESYDPAAFERFKEQVKKNGQFVAAIRKDEARKKKKEDALAQILLRFIQANQNSELMLLVSRLLEENIPASFILALIVLGNDYIKAAIKEHEMKQEMIEAERISDNNLPAVGGAQSEDLTPVQAPVGEFAVSVRLSDASLPIAIRVAMDEWSSGIFNAGTTQPFRILETVLDKEGLVKGVAIEAAAFVLHEFLVKTDEATFGQRGREAYLGFSEFMLKGIMKKLKEQIENQKQIG